MKLKAVLHKDCDPVLIDALQQAPFREAVLIHVLRPHLHVPDDFGPAEFYVQQCDLAESEPFCEARLTGVSVTEARSTKDFEDARKALELRYVYHIESWLKKDQRCQLMVSLMLDQIPFGRRSTLIEGPAIWVEPRS